MDKKQQQDEAMSKQAGQTSMIMSKNGLYYRLPQALSTAVNRTDKYMFSERSAYTGGQTMVFTWNTGTDYVDPQLAALSFEFGALASAAATYTFGTGLGACSLIDEIRILSKNGVEVDRLQNANFLAKIYGDYALSPDALRNAQLAGLNSSNTTASGVGYTSNTAFATAPQYNAVIPLKFLSGFFRPVVEDMLIPAGLASGLRFEITLSSDYTRVFETPADAITGFQISDPQMILSCSTLNDPTQVALVGESSASGLEYTFRSYFPTKIRPGAVATVNQQVNKAVSQCTRAIAVFYDVGGANNVDDTKINGFGSSDGDVVTAMQFRIGSNYYPQQTVTNINEMLYITQNAFGTWRNAEYAPNGVSLIGYNAANPTGAPFSITGSAGGQFVVAHSFETNDKLNLSGVPVNNSSVLEFRCTQTTAQAREIIIYMEFITVARTNLNKTSIKI